MCMSPSGDNKFADTVAAGHTIKGNGPLLFQKLALSMAKMRGVGPAAGAPAQPLPGVMNDLFIGRSAPTKQTVSMAAAPSQPLRM
jgi:hypothetical protein